MAFTREQAQQYLAQHPDPEAALIALEAQREEAQEGRDREGRAAVTARTQRDSARSELDTAREEVRAAQQRVAPEGAVVLTADDATAWQTAQQYQGGLSQALSDATEGRNAARSLTVNRAAAALNVPEADLTDFLGDRLPVVQSRQQDGQTIEVYGLGEGDAFRPLAEIGAIRALQGTQEAAPPRTVPGTQQRANTRQTQPDPVNDYARRLFRGKKETT